MVHHILVPLDGSAAAEGILPHVHALTNPAPVPVHLVGVVDPTRPSGPALAYLHRVQEAWSERLPSLQVTVIHGDPVRKILTLALHYGFDLIALTSKARTGVGSMVFGDTAGKILHLASMPLYLVRPEVEPRPLRRILVPLDGSERSMKILPIAGDLARATGAEVVLLEVKPTPVPDAIAESHLHRAEAELKNRGIPCRAEVREGEPAPGILAGAAAANADLIALTTHGRTGMARLRYGSVALDVLHRSALPMLVLRTGLLSRMNQKKSSLATAATGNPPVPMARELLDTVHHLPRLGKPYGRR